MDNDIVQALGGDPAGSAAVGVVGVAAVAGAGLGAGGVIGADGARVAGGEVASAVGLVAAAARREALVTAVAALEGLAEVLWQVQGDELAAWVTLVDRLAGLAAGARVALTAEAAQRGEINASQAGSIGGWLSAAAPSLAAAGGVGSVSAVVDQARRPSAEPLVTAVVSGQLAAPVAVTIVRELERLRPRLIADAVPTVLGGMIQVGSRFGSRAVRELRARIIAEHGMPGEFDALQEAAAGLVSLSAPVGDELGMFTYRLLTDAVGKAVLEAAIGPVAKPVPQPDGSPDQRPAAVRRAQALIEVCRRATDAGTALPGGVKTTLMVNMSLADLQTGLRAGTTIGSSESGSLLSAGVVRRLACSAGLVPVVLGGASELLDVGQTVRLFTKGLLKALWLRDGGCTFPGCSMPAHWCDAHHVRHWLDGGRTALLNAALLCERHHTVVHRDRLTATVTSTGVTWDTAFGSYDRTTLGRPTHWNSHASGATDGSCASAANAWPG